MTMLLNLGIFAGKKIFVELCVIQGCHYTGCPLENSLFDYVLCMSDDVGNPTVSDNVTQHCVLYQLVFTVTCNRRL